MFVSQDVETFNPFDVEIGGMRVNTGLVTLSLDTTHPKNETILFNFDTMTVTLHTDLLIHAPLLNSLGLSPVPIQVNEAGSIDLTELARDPLSLIAEITFTTSSSGVIGSGPLQGFAYSAPKRRPACNPRPCPGWVMAITVDGTGNAISGLPLLGPHQDFLDAITEGVLTSPDGLQQINISGERHGEISATPAPAAVPQPSSLILVLSGLAIGVGVLLRELCSANSKSLVGISQRNNYELNV